MQDNTLQWGMCTRKQTKVQMLPSAAPRLSACDRTPCRAHYSADCEWGVMPWMAGLFCCSRSPTSIPPEEEKKMAQKWSVAIDWFKDVKRRSYFALFDTLCQTPTSSVCPICAVVHAAAQAQAQAEERRSLAGNSPGPTTNTPAKPQGCKPGKRHRTPGTESQISAQIPLLCCGSGLPLCFHHLTCGLLQLYVGHHLITVTVGKAC